MTDTTPTYESTKWTQKEVLLFVQKINFEKRYANLPSVNWSGLDLRGVNLKNAHLKFANLSNCNLQYADLENANVCVRKFSPTTPDQMQLRYANLSGSDLSNAKLVSTEMSEANCKDCKFTNATGLGERFKQKWGVKDASEGHTKIEERSESTRVLNTSTEEIPSPKEKKEKKHKHKKHGSEEDQ